MQQPTPPELRDARGLAARPRAGRSSHSMAAPIRAGMRARAIADACDQLALAAILVDKTGRVLHVAPSAARLMADVLVMRGGHLVGRDAAANAAIQSALTSAVGRRSRPVVAPAGDTLAITGLAYRDRSPYQILRGVLVLSEDRSRDVDSLSALQSRLCA